jgi:hypothetical protein
MAWFQLAWHTLSIGGKSYLTIYKLTNRIFISTLYRDPGSSWSGAACPSRVWLRSPFRAVCLLFLGCYRAFLSSCILRVSTRILILSLLFSSKKTLGYVYPTVTWHLVCPHVLGQENGSKCRTCASAILPVWCLNLCRELQIEKIS